MERPRSTNLEPYAQIYAAIFKSKAGESLRNTYRWSDFRTDETDEKWYDALGETAEDFSHGWLMYQYGIDFLSREKGRFTKSQEKTFLLGLVVHDWGEVIIDGVDSVGDIKADLKTIDEEKKESIIARLVIESLDLPQNIKDSLVRAYEQVVEGQDPELHKYFKALEKSEYVFTAMRVFNDGEWNRQIGRAGIKNEEPFVGRVLIFDLAKVLDVHAPDYPDSIGAYIYEKADLIDQMFAHALPWLTQNKEWNEKPVDHKALAESFKAKWENFKNSDEFKNRRFGSTSFGDI
jgi:hypothetical protein